MRLHGSTGWINAGYARRYTEGNPDELTALMYYAEYDKAAEYLRSHDDQTVRAYQDGVEVDAAYVSGTATLVHDSWIYTGEVAAGKRQGVGVLVGIDRADPEGYTVLSGSWLEDKAEGSVILSRTGHSDQEEDLRLRGTIRSGFWNGDLEITPDPKGENKHYYAVPENGSFPVLKESEQGYAIAVSTDGSCWYVKSKEDLTGNGVGTEWDV